MPLLNLVGVFAITRLRLFLVISLALTWWFAYILPQYKLQLQTEISIRLQRVARHMSSFDLAWHQGRHSRMRYNESKIALLIEPRALPHLVPLLLHMMSVVPYDWRFLFVGSSESVVMVERAFMIQHHQASGKLDARVLPSPWALNQKEDVDQLLTDIRFYDKVLPGVEWMFKYDSDSILCSNSEKSLDDWLNWSWVGLGGDQSNRFTGFEGLSIRRLSAVRRILRFQQRYNYTEPEDMWFMKRFKVLTGEAEMKSPTGSPSNNNLATEKPMGYHFQPDGNTLDDQVWKDPGRRRQILEYCPELTMMMDMKLERERCPDDNRDGSRGPPIQVGVQEAQHNDMAPQGPAVRITQTVTMPPPPPPLSLAAVR